MARGRGRRYSLVHHFDNSAERLRGADTQSLPVIVRPEHYASWLDPDEKDAEKISEVFLPFPAEEMYAYPVSHRVNNVKNDESDLVQPAVQL